jgi:hypothetical protein
LGRRNGLLVNLLETTVLGKDDAAAEALGGQVVVLKMAFRTLHQTGFIFYSLRKRAAQALSLMKAENSG